MILTIAVHQVRSLRRQRILLALLVALLVMTALAALIGWSSQRTIARVYTEAVALLAATGQPAPPDPVTLKPTLSMLSNMAIYIPLVGALLALVVGHMSVADDRSDGVGRLVFSRQVSRTSYVLGTLLGTAAMLAAVLAASLAVSAVSLVLLGGRALSVGDVGRLVLFYALSWLYLMLFAVVGMATVMTTSRRSLALLAALGVWLVLTFVVPQFTSGLRPTASLNPVTEPVSTSQPFFNLTARARPFSVSEQYKEASARILATAPAEPVADTVARVAPIASLLGGVGLLTLVLVRRHDYSRSTPGE